MGWGNNFLKGPTASEMFRELHRLKHSERKALSVLLCCPYETDRLYATYNLTKELQIPVKIVDLSALPNLSELSTPRRIDRDYTHSDQTKPGLIVYHLDTIDDISDEFLDGIDVMVRSRPIDDPDLADAIALHANQIEEIGADSLAALTLNVHDMAETVVFRGTVHDGLAYITFAVIGFLNNKPEGFVYAYEIPGYEKFEDCLKIGYTRRDPVTRIKEQIRSAVRFDFNLVLTVPAFRDDGTPFKDTDVHRRLRERGHQQVEGEWFRVTVGDLDKLIREIKSGC